MKWQESVELPSAQEILNLVSNFKEFAQLALPVRHYLARQAMTKCIQNYEELLINTNELDFIFVVRGFLKLTVADIHNGLVQTFSLEPKMKVEH